MSYLARPRIGFFGTDAMTNPSTANNENVIHLLDYDNVELLNPPVVHGAELPPMDPAAYREWMTSYLVYADPYGPEDTQPNWQPGMPGYWNYWGDHLTTFGTAKGTSVSIGDEPVTDPAVDPLCGATFAFNARIVDVNPADTFASQFVAASFSIIGHGLDGNVTELVRGVPTTAITRWLNFYRYRGAGTFQAVVPNSSLRFVDRANAPHSAGLDALRAGAAAGGGLLLRWCFYGMAAAADQLTMYDRFAQGERAMNPKIGRVVGSVGVWNGTDLCSVPVGRILQQPGPPYFAATAQRRTGPAIKVKTHADVERIELQGSQLNALNAQVPCAQSMGPAAAYVDGDRVVLDLNTAFPEVTCSQNAPADPFAKHDFGVVNLQLVYDPGTGERTAVLGPVPYDQATYERLGAVVEIPFDPASEAGRYIADGWLQLADTAGNPLLQEIDVVEVATDDQAVYLDLQDKLVVRASGSAALRVFYRGEPSKEPVTLTVEVWRDVQQPGKANSINPLVLTATEIGEQLVRSFELDVPPGGRVDVPIEADSPACYKLRYVAPGMHVDQSSPDWAVEYYSTFRVLPYDDYSGVPDADLTFDFVYREVFNYYAILYPIMGSIIPWGPENTPHDPERVAQFASLMLQAVDESRVGTALEMPITRELSAGKRALLQRWCRLQLVG